MSCTVAISIHPIPPIEWEPLWRMLHVHPSHITADSLSGADEEKEVPGHAPQSMTSPLKNRVSIPAIFQVSGSGYCRVENSAW